MSCRRISALELGSKPFQRTLKKISNLKREGVKFYKTTTLRFIEPYLHLSVQRFYFKFTDSKEIKRRATQGQTFLKWSITYAMVIVQDALPFQTKSCLIFWLLMDILVKSSPTQVTIHHNPLLPMQEIC